MIVYHQNRYAAALESAVPPGARWLDLGAGDRLHGGWGAHDSRALASTARYIVGCDVPACIPHLKRHPYLRYRLAALGENLPFPSATFDVVSANMVLEHLGSPAHVFQEIARVLRPGGCFVFVTPNLHHPVVFGASIFLHPKWRSWLAHLWDKRAEDHIFPTYYRANTTTVIERLASRSGLMIDLLEPFASAPFTSTALERAAVKLLKWRSNLVGVLRAPGPSNTLGPNSSGH